MAKRKKYISWKDTDPDTFFGEHFELHGLTSDELFKTHNRFWFYVYRRGILHKYVVKRSKPKKVKINDKPGMPALNQNEVRGMCDVYKRCWDLKMTADFCHRSVSTIRKYIILNNLPQPRERKRLESLSQ